MIQRKTQNIKEIEEYIQKIKKIKNGTEHSGRTHIQNLLNGFTEPKKIDILQEPIRKKGVGSPDFKFSNDEGSVIGYLETKKVGDDLNTESAQIEKYKTLTENLILTDYLRWIWIHGDDAIQDIRIIEESALESKEVQLDPKKCSDFKELIDGFLSQSPSPTVVKDKKELAEALAKPTWMIKQEVEKETKLKKNLPELEGLWNSFKKTISDKIKASEFADAFSQTLTYSLFLTKLNLKNQNQKLELDNISNHLSGSFVLVKNILRFIDILKELPKIKPYLKSTLHIINHMDTEKILKSLKFTQDQEKDAYIYFYEDFLRVYDPDVKVNTGVYYTPNPVVRAIVKNIENLLKTEFALEDGLRDERVKLLDFATGTGTFLLEIYDQILKSIPKESMKRKSVIQNHILKNLYGFELLIPAYSIAHLKLSEYLKTESDYTLQKGERIPVYLTNTLEIFEGNQDQLQMPHFSLFPQMVNERKMADHIKETEKILVITGNPPYNAVSQNPFKSIEDLIQPYFPKDEIKERQIKWLYDDYVKFIRFAEDKIVTSGEGIVAIITSHSFLDNPTFRAMRKHLMESFDQIYLIDLHGNLYKKEKSPDGSKDQNVFDIQQGVSISFFIKTKFSKTDEWAKVHHTELFGLRSEKFQDVQNIRIGQTKFKTLEPEPPYFLFIPQNKTFEKEYEKGISIRDIFEKMSTGILSARDQINFDFEKSKLIDKLNEFLKLSEQEIFFKYKTKNGRDWTVEKAKKDIGNFNKKKIIKINYRPFDERYCYYTGNDQGIMQCPRHNIMKHFVGHENIGLVVSRQCKDDFKYCFVSNKIAGFDLISNRMSLGGGYVAPLYLYTESDLNLQKNQKKSKKITKELNFKSEFWAKMQKQYKNPTPESILGYIYGVLHSPIYRKKYVNFLKMDFPRVLFIEDPNIFEKISKLGSELIDFHVMRKVPKLEIGEPISFSKKESKRNYTVETVDHDPKENRLYFNKKSYFEKVSKEIWEFKIGGYQVIQKYLKERKDKSIESELEHIQKMINIIGYTITQMQKIDQVLKPVFFKTIP